MKRLISFITFFGAIYFFSCNEKKDTSEVIASYKTIRSAIYDANETQNNFFKKATELLGEVKDNKDAVVDTKGLKVLLDSAISSNDRETKTISLAKEPDDEIEYKQKALRFVYLLSDLYQNEFVRYISILNSNSENRFEDCKPLLY